LGIAQHQTDVPGYGLVSFLMGDAHPTGLLNVITYQGSTAAIYPQQHCVGWALPNTKQTFQHMVWYRF
jgi:hypothetical protein